MIHLIGNSHVSSFSNKTVPPAWFSYPSDYFIPVCLGPVTAFNFYDNHKDYIIKYLEERLKPEDKVTFIAGEVDCRVHLPAQADKQNKTDEIIVEECINKFKRLFELSLSKGKTTFSFGTHATTAGGHDPNNINSPVYGDMKRRNNICKLWNFYLEKVSKELGITFTSIYDKLVDENNNTKVNLMADYCHLQSPLIYPFIIEELKNKGII